jgi:hypothetical protein
MSKFDCQNLTSAIFTLRSLQQRVDLATKSFIPQDGVLAKEKASQILSPLCIRSLFEEHGYHYFMNIFDRERLKERISYLETTGMYGYQQLDELKTIDNDVSKSLEFMLRNPEFKVVPRGSKIPMIRLKLMNLFRDERRHTIKEIFDRAKELGLSLLPHEIAVDLMFDKTFDSAGSNKSIYIGSKPITGKYARPRIFMIDRSTSKPFLFHAMADPTTYREYGDEFIFGLKQKNKDTYK